MRELAVPAVSGLTLRFPELGDAAELTGVMAAQPGGNSNAGARIRRRTITPSLASVNRFARHCWATRTRPGRSRNGSCGSTAGSSGKSRSS